MAKVVTLGTGSGKPTLKRSVSAVAVVWEDEWILFDCGEATQIQVMRSGLHSSRLRAIFITHLHGDHFNGLAGFLSTMGLDRREEGLVVLGPPGIREYLALLRRLKILYLSYPLEIREFGSDRFGDGGGVPGAGLTGSELLGSAMPLTQDACGPRDMRPQERRPREEPVRIYEGAKYAVWALPLDHRVFTLGYRIEEQARPGRFNLQRALEIGVPEGPLFGRLQAGHEITLADGRIVQPSEVLGPARTGKTLAYCTDTRPCAAGQALGQGADLLVHEATFADDLQSEAGEYGHSTASQAARVARAARPSRLVITHISARYPDARPLLDEAGKTFPNVELAEDLMEFEI
jgi:ribonuclease Z